MTGLYFEEYKVGEVYAHETARSVTDFDNIWYSCQTMNTQPLHSNFDFVARKYDHGKLLFNSLYTLSILLGQTTTELTRGTLIDTLSLTDITFPESVFAGDTLYSRTTVTQVSDSPDTANAGVVDMLLEGFNQSGALIASCSRTLLIKKRNYHL